MYHFISLHSCDYLKKTSTGINVPNDEAKQTMELKWLYKVGSEYELNPWPDSSIG